MKLKIHHNLPLMLNWMKLCGRASWHRVCFFVHSLQGKIFALRLPLTCTSLIFMKSLVQSIPDFCLPLLHFLPCITLGEKGVNCLVDAFDLFCCETATELGVSLSILHYGWKWFKYTAFIGESFKAEIYVFEYQSSLQSNSYLDLDSTVGFFKLLKKCWFPWLSYINDVTSASFIKFLSLLFRWLGYKAFYQKTSFIRSFQVDHKRVWSLSDSPLFMCY